MQSKDGNKQTHFPPPPPKKKKCNLKIKMRFCVTSDLEIQFTSSALEETRV